MNQFHTDWVFHNKIFTKKIFTVNNNSKTVTISNKFTDLEFKKLIFSIRKTNFFMNQFHTDRFF